jgi:signal transduction histidine kinase
VNEDFIDKYTRVPKVINHLLDTAYDAVKEKERIAQSKFELLSELTHDIRTPLTSIQTATETLCSGVEIKDEQKDTLHSIVSLDVSYLSKLVDDLLFLSILDERSEQSSRMTALVPLLDSLKEKYVSIASMKQISINYDSSDLHEILLPELEFLRLMNNLISNALFNAKTFVRLDVSLIDYQLRFLVENDFETIDKESINNFGKKKLKRNIDLKNKQSSIGLGSVIIASIVEKWGGKMEIELDEHSKIFRMNIIYPIKS